MQTFQPQGSCCAVKAVLRRFKTNAEINNEQTQKKIYLNPLSFQLVINDKPINLTPTEYAIIELMLSKPAHVFSRSQMTQTLKKCVANSQTRTIDFHIKNLRHKISEHLPEERIVQSVYGVGYKIVL